MISLFSEWLCNPSLSELCPKLNRRALQIIRMKGRPRHNIFYIPGPVATRMDATRSNPAHLHTLHPRDPTLSPSPALYGSSALGLETQRARSEYSSRRAGVAWSLATLSAPTSRGTFLRENRGDPRRPTASAAAGCGVHCRPSSRRIQIRVLVRVSGEPAIQVPIQQTIAAMRGDGWWWWWWWRWRWRREREWPEIFPVSAGVGRSGSERHTGRAG